LLPLTVNELPLVTSKVPVLVKAAPVVTLALLVTVRVLVLLARLAKSLVVPVWMVPPSSVKVAELVVMLEPEVRSRFPPRT